MNVTFRPADFAAWRSASLDGDWAVQDRYEELIDILEMNPDCWIYFSW